MKIEGIRKLDSNYYEDIIIRDGLVNIKGKKYSFIDYNNKSLSDNIKGLDDNGKTLEIVKYYLRNNTISSISEREYLSHYDKTFVGVSSLGKRSMYLQIPKNNEISNIITDKYMLDRYKTVYGREYERYEFDTKYKRSEYKVEDKVIKISLAHNDKGIPSFERIFFEELLLSLFKDSEVYVEPIYYDLNGKDGCEGQIFVGYFIKGTDKIIKVDGNLVKNPLSFIINKHNEEIKNCKRLQLKMEGF